MTQLRSTPFTADDLPEAAPSPRSAPGAALDGPVAEPLPAEVGPTHLLHFEPLAAQGAGLDIPCDPEGRVGLDALGDKARNDYFFARALIGCVFARPTVRQPCG